MNVKKWLVGLAIAVIIAAGGAYAVDNGYTARTDPGAWNIIDERLYLIFDQGASGRWLAESTELIEAGNANWPTVFRE